MATRRAFFKIVAAAAGTLALLFHGGIAQAKKLAIKLDKVPELKKVGGSTIIKLAGKKVMLIRETDKRVRALSPVCTHEGCIVQYDDDSRKLVCGCHNSFYDLNGNVLGGPAPKPLEAFTARLARDRIILTMN